MLISSVTLLGGSAVALLAIGEGFFFFGVFICFFPLMVQRNGLDTARGCRCTLIGGND